MFEKFLEGDNPTWEQVIDSIRAVNYNTVACDIERQLPGKCCMHAVVAINHFIAEMLDEEEVRHPNLEHGMYLQLHVTIARVVVLVALQISLVLTDIIIILSCS